MKAMNKKHQKTHTIKNLISENCPKKIIKIFPLSKTLNKNTWKNRKIFLQVLSKDTLSYIFFSLRFFSLSFSSLSLIFSPHISLKLIPIFLSLQFHLFHHSFCSLFAFPFFISFASFPSFLLSSVLTVYSHQICGLAEPEN